MPSCPGPLKSVGMVGYWYGSGSGSGGEQIFALVVPNYEALAEDYPGRDLGDEFLMGLIKREIENVNRTLASYKKISDFALHREEFEMNAQRKIKRFKYKQYENPAAE
jgi:long-chain acyl-CoA synthetase